MGIYKNIKQIESKSMQTNKVIVSRKKLHLFSLFFIFIVTFGTLGVSVQSLNISNEVKNITSSWAPNFTDLGKLKFVINQSEPSEDVFAQVSLMEMPFENTYITEKEEGVFLVNGLGGIIVKSCLGGKVKEIKDGEKKKIYVSHGKGLVSVYSDIDTLGVKVGDRVEKNTPLGVSNSSIINFQILYKNKAIAGLMVKDGELTFF